MISKLLKNLIISNEPTAKHSEQDIRIAAVALLIEVAKADHDLSDQEEQRLIEILDTLYELTGDDKQLLIDVAKDRSTQSTSLYEYTRIINDHFNADEKFQLIINMWKIAYTDEHIDRFEEHLIRRVADLIYVPHVQFIEAKHIAANTN